MDDIDIKCTHAIPVGDKDGPCPIVHGIAWNPKPEAYSEDTTAMLACVSSKGVSIYGLKRNKKKWTSLDIEHRPCSEANFLAWHRDGRVLATTSSARGGKLSILAYDGKDGFTAKTVLQCPGGESVTSLCWANVSRNLVLAIYPSSALCFLRVKDGDPENLENIGLVKYVAYFDTPSRILLASDSYDTLYAYSNNKLLRFRGSRKHQVAFKPVAAIDAPVGVHAIVFDEANDGLFTLAADKWTYWQIENSKLIQVATTSANEKSRRKGGEYTAIAVAPSGLYVATGGKDNLWCFDIVSGGDKGIEIEYKGCRNHDVNWGVVTCIAFHPMEDKTRLIALGGDTGYLYVWAVVGRGQMKSKYTELDRADLYKGKYYSRSFTNADRKDDKFVVSDPKCPTITLKQEDILIAEDIAQPDDDDSGSESTVGSPAAAAGSPVAAAAVGSPPAAAAAAGSSAAAAAAVGSPPAAAEITLADKFASIKKEAQKQIGELDDIASLAVDNIMSLGAQADELLSRKDQLTRDELTDFLKKVSSARKNKV